MATSDERLRDAESGNTEFPTIEERETLRYHYYIQHGVDTIHVNPINPLWLKRIKRLIPAQIPAILQPIIVECFEEINSDYTVAVKKAVVDFVLGDALKRPQAASRQKGLTAERLDVGTIALKYRHKFVDNRRKIARMLFAINPCVAQIMKAWHQYDSMHLIDLEFLMDHEEAFELTNFVVINFIVVISFY